MNAETLRHRLRAIRAVVTDVDGCLTDGGIILGGGDIEIKHFDVKDGMGVALANGAGLITAVQLFVTVRPGEDLEHLYLRLKTLHHIICTCI